MFGSFLPQYFSSEFSFTRLRLPAENSGENQVCALVRDTLHVITSDGTFYSAKVKLSGTQNANEELQAYSVNKFINLI